MAMAPNTPMASSNHPTDDLRTWPITRTPSRVQANATSQFRGCETAPVTAVCTTAKSTQAATNAPTTRARVTSRRVSR